MASAVDESGVVVFAFHQIHRIVKLLGLGVVSAHGECVAMDGDLLIVLRTGAEAVEAVAELNAVVLG